MHNAKFNKHNVLIDINANCVTCGMKGVPGANGSRNTIILQGQWESAIVKDETVWQLEADGKLVLDIRKRVEGHWKILIRSGINGDDSLIDPLSRVILGIAAAQSQNHDYALQCYERSAQEGSWHAMRKLAALYSPNSEEVFPNVVKDVKKSISYVQMGAMQPWNSDAQFILAHAYLSGFGVEADSSQYVHFLQEAAMLEQHSFAMFELAENLLSGEFVSPDPLRAVHFLEKASSLGHVIATWTLGQLLITGCDGVQRDTKRGIATVSAALTADPSLTKKVFVPYTKPQSQPPTSETINPPSSTPLDIKTAAKVQKQPSSSPNRWPLYGAAVVGVAVLASFMFSRMRRR